MVAGTGCMGSSTVPALIDDFVFESLLMCSEMTCNAVLIDV
jgi:hypothetical protein